jgi:hypothetical protein
MQSTLSSFLLLSFGVVAAAGSCWVGALVLRSQLSRACTVLGATFLGLAALVAFAAGLNPDPGLNPLAVVAWLALLLWALAGIALRRMPRPWSLIYLVPSIGLGLAFAAGAFYLRWVFKPFS